MGTMGVLDMFYGFFGYLEAFWNDFGKIKILVVLHPKNPKNRFLRPDISLIGRFPATILPEQLKGYQNSFQKRRAVGNRLFIPPDMNFCIFDLEMAKLHFSLKYEHARKMLVKCKIICIFENLRSWAFCQYMVYWANSAPKKSYDNF